MSNQSDGSVCLPRDPFGPIRCLSSSQLKWIALACMVVDHIAAIFVHSWAKAEPTGTGMLVYEAMRAIGRVTFVVFAYQLAVGAAHTRSLPKYLMRLCAFALVSQGPYYLAVSPSDGFFFSKLNIGFTLVLGMVPLACAEVARRRFGCKAAIVNAIAAVGAVLVAECVLFSPVHVDYGVYGIALICIFYTCRDYPVLQVVCGVLATQMYCELLDGYLQWFAVAGIVLVSCLSSGERGHMGRWVCYVFYPAHLLVLGVVRMLVLA